MRKKLAAISLYALEHRLAGWMEALEMYKARHRLGSAAKSRGENAQSSGVEECMQGLFSNLRNSDCKDLLC
ncbi:MAG: hypothetical protein ACOYU3_08470 [Bacillota bacterium]